MNQQEREQNFCLQHPKSKSKSGIWLIRPYCPRSNPKREGISYNALKQALNDYEPDELQYLDGTRHIVINNDRRIEEVYLKRCLRFDENVADWKIVHLVEELGNPMTRWLKTIIHNIHTGYYSGRSLALYNGDSYFLNKVRTGCVGCMSKDPQWFVEWTKLAVDKSFWIRVKELI